MSIGDILRGEISVGKAMLKAQTSLREELQARTVSEGVLVRPRRRGYFQDEQVDAQVFGLDGRRLGGERFRIGHSPGSGFGGQVYRALPLNGLISGLSAGETVQPVALKVLVPRSTMKHAFRELLFRLSYQTSFAPRLREEALRTGLIWQELLRTAARLEFGTDSVVARPYGYYWDARLASYVEIHQWVDGRTVRYEIDDHILQRWLGRTHDAPDTEMCRKRRCMAALVKLCQQMGALGLSRQYEWYTLVSQANILTSKAPHNGAAEFVGVDWRPGLAVPFFLPLTPVHASIIWRGLSNGEYAHFDEVDFIKLDAYLAAHAVEFESVLELVRQLKLDDARYRAGLPNLWHVRTRILWDRELRDHVKRATLADWRRLEQVSEEQANRLQGRSPRFVFFLLLDNLPFIGGWLLRWWGNENYRLHVVKFWMNAGYRRSALRARQGCDLLDWEASGRISPQRAAILADSTSRYLLDKLTLSWLPRSVHRLASDAAARRRLAQALIVHPGRLLVDGDFREAWLANILEQQLQKGVIDLQQVTVLRAQAKEARMQGFIRDLGLTIGLELFAKLLYLLLAAYGLRTHNFLPLGIAALGPIAPSGIVRAIYVLGQLCVDLPGIIRGRDGKLFWTRLLGLFAAPWRMLGNLFAPLEMFAYYNDMSLVLGDYYVSKMVSVVPVLGGRGKILEYWALSLAYNLPLSVRRMVADVLRENE